MNPHMDPTRRRFTIDHPIHIDLYGGIVKIIATNCRYKSNGIEYPLLGLRWQAGEPDTLDEFHYLADGSCGLSDKVHGFDLWDADLASIKPQARVVLGVISNAS